MCGKGCAWQGGMHSGGVHGRGACMAGGMRGGGSMHGMVGVGVHGRGYAWWGACVAGGGVCVAGGHAWHILRDMVNEWAVRILLECILVKVVSEAAVSGNEERRKKKYFVHEIPDLEIEYVPKKYSLLATKGITTSSKRTDLSSNWIVC